MIFRNIGHWGQALYVDNINITATVAIEENPDTALNMQVYPNPNNGQLYIALTAEQPEQGTIKITNAVGELVFNQTFNITPGAQYIPVDISAAASGAYLIQVATQNTVISKLAVKQ